MVIGCMLGQFFKTENRHKMTSPEKTGSGDVKTEKTKKGKNYKKKLKTNKKYK